MPQFIRSSHPYHALVRQPAAVPGLFGDVQIEVCCSAAAGTVSGAGRTAYPQACRLTVVCEDCTSRTEESIRYQSAAAPPSTADGPTGDERGRDVLIPDIDCLTQSPCHHSLAARGVIRRDAVWVCKPDPAAAASGLEGGRRVRGRCSGPISRPICSMKARSANWDYLKLSTGLGSEDLRAFGVEVAPPVSSDSRALAAALR